MNVIVIIKLLRLHKNKFTYINKIIIIIYIIYI